MEFAQRISMAAPAAGGAAKKGALRRPGWRACRQEWRAFVQAGCGVASWCRSSVERCDRNRYASTSKLAPNTMA